MTATTSTAHKPTIHRLRTMPNAQGKWSSTRLHLFVKFWKRVMEAQGVRVDIRILAGVTSSVTFHAQGSRLHLDVKGDGQRVEGYRGKLSMDRFPDEPVVLVDKSFDQLLERLQTEYAKRMSQPLDTSDTAAR
jgi:hypothetical protein